ncbi:MAG: hypothetical protein KGQ79_11030, partial [Proteobacteria bacterium]|nr:hypothetical protein [Pseudomonadota bacterium]
RTTGMAGNVIGFARKADDFIIDQVLQPGVNRAEWWLGVQVFTLARFCTGLGALAGLAWIKLFDHAYSPDFFEDMLCLAIMAGAAYVQINAQQAQGSRRARVAPAVRLTGLLWRTLWLLDLVLFPTQWPLESHMQLAWNFTWTLLLVLPYWLICCHEVPPREYQRELRYATIPVR